MPGPSRDRPKLKSYDLKTGARARKGITGAVYADIEDGSGRYQRRCERPNFTAVFIDAEGNETIPPNESCRGWHKTCPSMRPTERTSTTTTTTRHSSLLRRSEPPRV